MTTLAENGFNPRLIIENFLDEISELKGVIATQKINDTSTGGVHCGYNEGIYIEISMCLYEIYSVCIYYLCI
jgi:hypothetical protein